MTVRPLVAASWRRSAAVDPDAAPSIVVPRDEVADVRAAHPLAAALPVLRRLLLDDARSADLVVALADDAGRLLWVDGARTARRAAEDMGFVEGAGWSEDRVGTSAPGTALRLDRSVQIRGEEHYATAVKRWSCTAVPLHAPSGRQLGVVDITGGPAAVEGHALPLLAATAAAVEAELALAAARNGLEARPASAPHVARVGARSVAVLALLGTDSATLTVRERPVVLSARHSEILAVLAAHPGGLGAASLAEAVYGDAAAVGTLRPEMVRLRRVLDAAGSGVVLGTRPYRVSGLVTDVGAVVRDLDRGARRAAIRAYPGPVLPGSTAPGVDAVRERLRERFREAVVADGSVESMLAWTATADGGTDVAVLRELLRVLPTRSPRRASVVTALEALDADDGTAPLPW